MNKQFLAKLEARLEENKQLSSGGGLPDWLSPIATRVGLYTWQLLLLSSLLITWLCFQVKPGGSLQLVRSILFMK